MHNERLYRKLLTGFCRREAATTAAFLAALAAKDRHLLRQQVHSLKGESAQLGAVEVHAISEQLEAELQRPDTTEEEIAPQVDALILTMRSLCQALTAALGTQQP